MQNEYTLPEYDLNLYPTWKATACWQESNPLALVWRIAILASRPEARCCLMSSTLSDNLKQTLCVPACIYDEEKYTGACPIT